MTHIEVWLMALALAMDCFAVSMASGIIFRRFMPRQMLVMVLLFGLFQALNSLLGWLGAELFRDLIECIDHWIAFFLLLFIGGNMIKESRESDVDELDDDFGLKTMLLLAVATSIDALAVGVTFAFLRVNIIAAVLFIGCITFTCSAIGVKIGNVFGVKFKSKAELAGGVILILIGTKILLEHLGILVL